MSLWSMGTELLLKRDGGVGGVGGVGNKKTTKCKRLRRPLVSLMELDLPLWIPGLDAVNVILILPPLTKAERSARHMFGAEWGKIWHDSRAWKAKKSIWGRTPQPLIFVRFTAFASCKDFFFPGKLLASSNLKKKKKIGWGSKQDLWRGKEAKRKSGPLVMQLHFLSQRTPVE